MTLFPPPFAATSLLLENKRLLSVSLYVVAFLLALIFVSMANVVSAQTPPPIAATTPTATPPASVLLLQDHPLVGKIWDMHAKKWVSDATLIREAKKTPLVLIGETHDNQEHHRLQQQLLSAIAADKQARALVMEQFDVEHQTAITAATQALKRSEDATIDGRRMWLSEAADAIAIAGKLNRAGWQWPQYQPLVETAIQSGWPIVAANLSRTTARQVFSIGFAAIPATVLPVNISATIFNATWNMPRNEAVAKTMVDSHCGQLPAERAPGMVNAQRARDAVMAQAILTSSQGDDSKDGVIFIAGRGHARHDVGVPLYLRQMLREMKKDSRILSIGMVEVSAEKLMLSDYAELDSADSVTTPFDYVWFSQRQSRKDPCEGMSLGKIVK